MSDLKYQKSSCNCTLLHAGAGRKHVDLSPPRARKRFIPTTPFFSLAFFTLLLCSLILDGAVLRTPRNKAREMSKLGTCQNPFAENSICIKTIYWNRNDCLYRMANSTTATFPSPHRAKGTKLPCMAEHPPCVVLQRCQQLTAGLCPIQTPSASKAQFPNAVPSHVSFGLFSYCWALESSSVVICLKHHYCTLTFRTTYSSPSCNRTHAEAVSKTCLHILSYWHKPAWLLLHVGGTGGQDTVLYRYKITSALYSQNTRGNKSFLLLKALSWAQHKGELSAQSMSEMKCLLKALTF